MDRNARPLNEQAMLAAWATPKATDGSGGRTTATEGGGNSHLDVQARLASWATPRAEYSESSGAHSGKADTLTSQSRLTGETPSGSLAKTESSGQLNPSLSRWLQGLPISWDLAAFRVAESLIRARKGLTFRKASASSTRSKSKRKPGASGSTDTETQS
jgi:hypothetical protein